jgi:hypothetical protein
LLLPPSLGEQCIFQILEQVECPVQPRECVRPYGVANWPILGKHGDLSINRFRLNSETSIASFVKTVVVTICKNENDVTAGLAAGSATSEAATPSRYDPLPNHSPHARGAGLAAGLRRLDRSDRRPHLALTRWYYMRKSFLIDLAPSLAAARV